MPPAVEALLEAEPVTRCGPLGTAGGSMYFCPLGAPWLRVLWDQAALSTSPETVSPQPSPILGRIRNEKQEELPTGPKHTQIDHKSQTKMLILISREKYPLCLERWHKGLRETLAYQGASYP